MSLFIILTVIQAMIAAALVGVVLMQRSEGGGLGIGGNPSGALGARGAADFLTRSTKWLAVAFVVMSIVLAAMAVSESSIDDVSSTLDRDVGAPGAVDLLGEGTADEGTADEGGAASSDDLLGESSETQAAEPTSPGDDPLSE
ncbi:preprotein translocase subunit SecG [Erythrobacter sp. SCSIO 43205]|uniref:preprotein translocase subunit SecG n=1 Tax=Erythrobacter sp. SCSIO 43205 TaxID=2779361 RepID=UPI001CA8EBCC|nr:preprotein translocase subunit SecG [Erythrobacter sp. SCSIO 43205]UAB77213.1 preprotein translocase subunit SecG [Erythrobacter sp. SCSIO 43205]